MPSSGHGRHEYPREWPPSLGTCPKATWMTSICEPTAYGASFPMNSCSSLGLEKANLGCFSYAQGHPVATRGMNFHAMASIPWDMSKGNLDDLYLRTNSLRGVLPHELPPLSGRETSGKSETFLIRVGPSRDHERHEFAWEWLPSLGTCPKATWITSICEPTAYGASFPMNSCPSLGVKEANFRDVFHMRRAIEWP